MHDSWSMLSHRHLQIQYASCTLQTASAAKLPLNLESTVSIQTTLIETEPRLATYTLIRIYRQSLPLPPTLKILHSAKRRLRLRLSREPPSKVNRVDTFTEKCTLYSPSASKVLRVRGAESSVHPRLPRTAGSAPLMDTVMSSYLRLEQPVLASQTSISSPAMASERLGRVAVSLTQLDG